MASLIISNFTSLSPLPPPLSTVSNSRTLTQLSFHSHGHSRSHERRITWGRGLSLITPPRAGPSTTTYIVAFFLPLSLMLGTIFTSIRISDKLDRQFFEEVAINQAILEAAEYDDDDDDEDEADISVDEETTLPRSRNRPKREAEVV